MNNSLRKSDCKETLDAINTWPFAFMVGLGFLAILLMQSAWNTISGLYFDYAYEAIVIPYTIYATWNIYRFGNGGTLNKAKLSVMVLAFLLLFLPNAFLLISGQLDFHAIIFNEYDSSLRHLPLAHLLPYIALGAVLLPYKDFLK